MKRSVALVLLMPAALVAVPGQAALAAGCRPALKDLTAPATAHAGDDLTARATLSCAPSSDTRVVLNSNRSELAVPAGVVVRRGQTTADVPVAARLVDGPQYKAQVTARQGGRSATREITVNPGLKSFSLTPTSAPNGVAPVVRLTGPAPAGGLVIGVASDHPDIVTLPATEDFQEGATAITFSARRVADVAQDTRVTVSVTLGARTLSASKLLLRPFDGTQKVELRAAEPGDLYGLQFGQSFNVILSRPAPEAGLSVALKAQGDDPAVRLDNVTDHIGGGDTTAYFRLDTADVTKTTTVVLEATVSGATTTLPITIHPRIADIALPASAKGGSPFTATIKLAGPSAVDTTVHLSPSWGILHPPGHVTIPAGSTSATFEVGSSQVDEPSSVFLTGYLGRTEFQSERVTLTP
ncbi:hypothetical protein [Actinomadura rubrisoli]|uniref:Uncharacterized protein n=1 Tax=Actinomadura rubrisoli TaxID=2530368 RepID=A0A4R5BD38_9ACTN|nr:hypothetical protein [Actinomadura rubrisoli]TDD82690.1 hypothetical protein E1298_22375 [Actinomadura rubrisoli]